MAIIEKTRQLWELPRRMDFGRRQRVMFYVALLIPPLVLISGLIHVYRYDFQANILGLYVFFLCVSCCVGRFLYLRAQDLEASFGTTRLSSDSDEVDKSMIEWGSVIADVALMAVAIFPEALKQVLGK